MSKMILLIHFFSFHQLGQGKNSLDFPMTISLRLCISKVSKMAHHPWSWEPFEARIAQASSWNCSFLSQWSGDWTFWNSISFSLLQTAFTVCGETVTATFLKTLEEWPGLHPALRSMNTFDDGFSLVGSDFAKLYRCHTCWASLLSLVDTLRKN